MRLRKRERGRGAAPCRPFVEPLEDRCVPAVPVTGAVETSPVTQVAQALPVSTATGPGSSQVTLTGATAATAAAATTAALAPGAGSAVPETGTGVPTTGPAEVGLAAPSGPATGTSGDALTAGRQALSPFLTTVQPAYVSNFGPQAEGVVVVRPTVPDQASIGFPGRVVFPDTDLRQRANITQGPFEQPRLAFPRVVPASEQPPPREEAPAARPAGDAGEARPDAATAAWLEMTLIPPGLPELPLRTVPPNEGK